MNIDLTYLNEMSGGNKELIMEMIDIFAEQVGLYKSEIEAAMKKKDWLSLAKTAHKAKSSVAIMGMKKLSSEMKKLEKLALENKENETYWKIIHKFITETDKILVELKKNFIKN